MASSSSHGGRQGNNDGGGGGGGCVDCAACRVLGKKCGLGCIMAPHFPGNDPGITDFSVVKGVFGTRAVRGKLAVLDLARQKEVVKSLKWEAYLWMQHPIDGPYGYHCSMMQKQSQEHQQQFTALQERHQQQLMALQQQQRQQQPDHQQQEMRQVAGRWIKK